MDQRLACPRRGRAFALAFLALFAGFAAGCGGDKGGSVTGPPEPEPPDPVDPGPQGPAPVGTVMYAVDLSNNFLVFGSGGVGTLTAKMKITGVPILKRIIGLALRPSDNAVIGIGNDSRVYTINPMTAKATPLNGTLFSPQISSIFDTHFGMALEPNGQRVRLIAAESGANWSIDIQNGSATKGKPARYGAGSPLQGGTPRLLGLVYPTLPDSAKGPGWCANLAYGIDADKAVMLASCDPDGGFWYPTGLTPPGSARALVSRRHSSNVQYNRDFEELKDLLLRCGEFMESAGGSDSDGEEEPAGGVGEGGPWFPRSPDTEFYVFLVEVGTKQNRSGTVKLIDGQKWGLTLGPDLGSVEPVQSVVFDKGGPYSSSSSAAAFRGDGRPGIQAMVGNGREQETDPRASCAGGS